MIVFGAETFDGGDLLAGDVAQGGLAGSHGFAVDVNRAGAAQAGAAAEFGAGHLQLLADGPQQWRVRRRLDGHIPPIDIEIRHAFFPCRCMMPLTAATHFSEWPDTHRAGVDLARENDRVPIQRQCNSADCSLCDATTMLSDPVRRLACRLTGQISRAPLIARGTPPPR